MRRHAISDTHWGHYNVLDFDQRPFETIEEHDEVLVERWNGKVAPKDEVFHLGDAFWNVAGFNRVRGRLNGKIHLIMGNHDHGWSKSRLEEVFVDMCQIRTVSVAGTTVLMCHYPIIDAARHDMPLLHGHVHGKDHERIVAIKNLDFHATGPWYNVGCMLHNFEPIDLEELVDGLINNEDERFDSRALIRASAR